MAPLIGVGLWRDTTFARTGCSPLAFKSRPQHDSAQGVPGSDALERLARPLERKPRSKKVRRGRLSMPTASLRRRSPSVAERAVSDLLLLRRLVKLKEE
jgi:hypothetical protein